MATTDTKNGQLAVSKIVLYAMIGSIALVLIIIIILIICLCKRRKQRNNKKGLATEMKIIDENENQNKTILCKKSKKKKQTATVEKSPVPFANFTAPYEPGTMIEGVYERISSADIESKYEIRDDVIFLPKPNDKIEPQNTYVTIGRSNSFNPRRGDRPVVRKSRDELGKQVNRNESIKLIETGIVPSETFDVKARLLEISKTENDPRVKQKRTSHKKGNPTPRGTHELVKITPPAEKKDLNKVTRAMSEAQYNQKLQHTSPKPPSVSGASVISSNDGSEAASNLGTDSGYEEINSENSPTVKRIPINIDDVDTLQIEPTGSTRSSPIPSVRKNYIEVEVLPCSRLLEQRSNSIIARRNSQRPESEDCDDDGMLLLRQHNNYTQVTFQ